MRDPGRYSVGDGLLLVVNAGGSRSWLARVMDPAGRRRDLGLGRYPEVTLKEARERAAGLRRQARDGLDPVAEKRKAKVVTPTFKEAAERAYEERKDGFRNDKHAWQWITTLRQYAYPSFGNLPVDQVTGPLIVGAMKKIWTTKPETARRTLQRIGTVIAWATAHGFREHEAPMQAIRMGLPPQPKAGSDHEKAPKHHAALPYVDAPVFMRRLRAAERTTARTALELLILTAARSGEVRGARWAEFDLEAGTWLVPASRMKMGIAHLAPLSTAALALLRELYDVRSSDLVFPGIGNSRTRSKVERQLSDAAVSKALAALHPGVTVHGWRSTFKDWASEETNVPSEVSEKALAHQIPSAVERAYRRGDLLEKRRALMEAWAGYVGGRSAEVVQLREVA